MRNARLHEGANDVARTGTRSLLRHHAVATATREKAAVTYPKSKSRIEQPTRSRVASDGIVHTSLVRQRGIPHQLLHRDITAVAERMSMTSIVLRSGMANQVGV